ncbi:MAG: hypothetical protein J0L67_16605 [Cytophagales bacterium]|nr:hypothetical protein [Cytophagales bacterium]
MKSNRTIDYIIIVCFLTLIGLYILKVEWSGLLLYIFSLAVSVWFLITEIKKKMWSSKRISLVVILLIIITLALQALLANVNNMILICVGLTVYSFGSESSKFFYSRKKT